MTTEGEQREQTPVEVLKPVSMTALEAIERGQIDISISTAKRYPRDLASVRTEMKEMACRDPETAASCSYALPRAGKTVEGPSVRLAEIAAACYGNLSVATRVIEMNDEVVKAQSVCHDMQKNVRIALEIPRNVQGPKGPVKNLESFMRDARHTAALAASSIAFRESVFKVIPRSLVQPVWEEAKKVATGSGRSFDEARETCLQKFAELGVGRKAVYQFLNIGGSEALNTAHLQLLHGVLTAINDGDTTVEAEFGKPSSAPSKAAEEAHKVATEAIEKAERQVKEYKLGPIDPEKRPPAPQKPPEAPLKSPTAKAPEPKVEQPPPKEEPKVVTKVNLFADMDPVYGRVARKMEESKVTFHQLLRVLSYWGLDIKNVKQITDIKLQFMRTADNDWPGVMGELAMNPDEAA